MDYLEHITREGERWDSLAWRYYGDAFAYGPLIEANPHLRITPRLPAGQMLLVPFIESDSNRLSQSLPPWKR